ncbi:class I SAM-dependent methyltransferase [Picosynechococcus sp. NKBG15041c]|uniref:class I SAM-dependent methyltransferase n=1 Tax=Picosynechococcus sp. NKBG15041c TaxID=1407650 RepID=UPI001F3B4C4C|nr:class I SAM-dependent methyltransferase [Picosynechococcus sp. NKBG15041c]
MGTGPTEKNQHCLDLGCGLSFLIYPWRDWNAYFYGQDISQTATEILQSRAPQLNSKLFKSIVQKPAHHLESYQTGFFDLAIATGFSCYYPLPYWESVLEQVQRVLKPGGFFVFDVVDPTQDIAEDWSILETYQGAEVFLEGLDDWQALIKKSGAKIVKEQPGELFHLYKIRW